MSGGETWRRRCEQFVAVPGNIKWHGGASGGGGGGEGGDCDESACSFACIRIRSPLEITLTVASSRPTATCLASLEEHAHIESSPMSCQRSCDSESERASE